MVALFVTGRPAGVPVTVGNYLELNLSAGGSLKAFLGPDEHASINLSHQIEGVGIRPVRTKQILGTGYDVVVVNNRTILNLLGIQRYGLVLKIKLESQVVGTALLEVVILIFAIGSLTPVVGVVGVMVGNHFVLQGVSSRNGNIVSDEFVQTVGLVKRHVVIVIGRIPGGTEDVLVVANNSKAVKFRLGNISFYLELHRVGVECELIRLTKGTGKTVGDTTVGRFLGGVLNTGLDCFTRGERAIAVV